MSGGATTTQNQQQQTNTQPWAPAQPMLMNILSQLGNVSPNITPAQQQAISQIEANANSLPNYSGQTQGLLSQLFAGGGATGQIPTVQNAYGKLQSSLSALADPANLDPTKTPGLTNALDTVRNDVSNQIRGQFAAAGRPAGTNADVAQAEARGVAQAEAPILLGQYNTNVGNLQNAAGSLFGGGLNTAGAVSGLQQTGLGNELQGIGVAGALPGIANQGAMSTLQAESMRSGIPLGILQQMAGIGGGIAGLGNQSQGTMSGTTTQNQSLLSTLLGASFGGLGLLGGTGAFGSSGWLNPSSAAFMFSDERVKEDIAAVGELNDGTPVYSYRYVGDETPRIGLLAQDVEKRDPGAVAEFGGVKAVDYERATRPSRVLGMLRPYLEAA